MKHTMEELKHWQALPLEEKIRMTQMRIAQWYRFYDGDVYVSFSGGKDSTVLLDICRRMYDLIDAVFVDTGLEYPELREFVMQHDNVTVIKPKMTFRDVICKYGYPLFSKEISEVVYGARIYVKNIEKYMQSATGGQEIGNARNPEDLRNAVQQLPPEIPHRHHAALLLGMKDKHNQIRTDIPNRDKSVFSKEKYQFMLNAPFEISHMCCKVMKKKPLHEFWKETRMYPITAQMASESKMRTRRWLAKGCNAFDGDTPISNPMSFWTEQDVLTYIREKRLPIAPIYGDIVPDDDGMYQMELFSQKRPSLKTTGCDRTGCFACGYGMHLEKTGNNRLQKIIELSNPKLADWELRGGHFRDSDGMWEPYQGLGYWFPLMWIEAHSNIRYTIPNREYYLQTYGTDETRRWLDG